MNKPEEFLTLEVSTTGFVVYGLGAGARKCTYCNKPLPAFLEQLSRQFPEIKEEINKAWHTLDRTNADSPENQKSVHKLLIQAHTAYSLIIDLQPFATECMDGPTTPLRHFWLARLEEIYTKCFAAAHAYGSPEQRQAGLEGLLTDFEWNGGVDTQTGMVGKGFSFSMGYYFRAYFRNDDNPPRIYVAFGELSQALADMVQQKYPLMAESLGAEIASYQEGGRVYGFNPYITCPEKPILLAQLTSTAQTLQSLKKAA